MIAAHQGKPTRYSPHVIASHGDWGLLSVHADYRFEDEADTEEKRRKAKRKAMSGDIEKPTWKLV